MITPSVSRPLTPASETPELKPLTTFRFFAALAVLVSHLSFLADDPMVGWIYIDFFKEGYIGVVFFFILSGFILTYNYHTRLVPLRLDTLEKFHVSRFARIYPVHVLTFGLAVLLMYSALPSDVGGELIRGWLNLTLLQSYLPSMLYYLSFNAPSWSLANEIFFYTLLPFILAGLVKARVTAWRRALGLALALWFGAFIFVARFPEVGLFSHWLFFISPYFQVINFLFGVLLAYVFIGLQSVRLATNVFTWLELFALSSLGVTFSFFSAVPQTLRYSVYYAPAFALVILVFAFQKGWFSRLLAQPLFVLLGEISFSLYMFHSLFLMYVHRFDVLESNLLWRALLVIGLSVGASYLCYRFYESPLRAWLRRHLRLTAPTSNPTSARDSAWTRSGALTFWLSGLGLILGLGWSYLPILTLTFLDRIWNQVEAVTRLTSWQYLAFALDPRVATINFRPVFQMLFLLQAQLFRLDFLGFQIVRWATHLLGALLLFWVIHLVSRNLKLALISTAVLASLPVYARTVMDRADATPEMMVFALGSILSWIRFVETRRRVFYGLTLLAFALALFTKETATPLLLILLFVEKQARPHGGVYPSAVRRYALFFIILFVYLVTQLMVQPPGPETFAVLVWVPIVILVFVFSTFGETRAVRWYFVIGGILWSAMFLYQQGEQLLSQHWGDLIAIVLIGAMWWGARRGIALPRLAQWIGVGVIGVVLVANRGWIVNAAAEWNEIARQRRVPFRDIVAQHSNLPDDTYLYFIEPLALRDLSGLFYWRYGARVTIGSATDNPVMNVLLYPSFERLGASDLTRHVGKHQIAGWRDHAHTWVYYFDTTGRPIGVAVERDAVFNTVPTLPAIFGNQIQLDGYEIARKTVRRGQALVLNLYWRARQPLAQDYAVFVHLIDAEGVVVDSYDSQPRRGQARTRTWKPDQVVTDPIVLPIAREVASDKTYRLAIGLYDEATSQRLVLTDAHGQTLGDKVIIESVKVIE